MGAVGVRKIDPDEDVQTAVATLDLGAILVSASLVFVALGIVYDMQFALYSAFVGACLGMWVMWVYFNMHKMFEDVGLEKIGYKRLRR